MILITRKYLLTLARDDNRNPLASSFPAFSFRWFPMAKMYSKTATNFWLDCSCLLAWIFWIIIWNTQTCPQIENVGDLWCLCLPCANPHCAHPKPLISPRISPYPNPSGIFSKNHLKLPQDQAVLAQSPQKESHPFWLPEQPQPPVFCCLAAQISGIGGSRVCSSILHLPPFSLHQLNAVIKILSTVSPQGRIIISCTQTQYNSFFPGKPPPF